MDILFAQIQADLRSNDALRQSGALLQALQQSAAGRDISVIAKSAVEEIVASPASAVSKKLAFDLIRSTRLTSDLWETVCTGIRTDLDFPDPDVTAAAVSILAAIPSYRIGKLITDCSKEVSNCFDSPSDNLRFSITETLGCILARDDIVTLCENNINLLDRVSNWWTRIGQNMLGRSDAVSTVAFESVGRLFQEFESKRMSRLAGDKLVDSENSVLEHEIVAVNLFPGSGSDSTSRVVLEHEIVGSTIGSAAGSSSSSHATRGQTRNLSLGKKKDSGVSLVLELNEDSGRIVGNDSGLYITESGCVVRKLGRFDVAKWANLDEDLKKDLINIAKEGFEFPDSIGMQKAMEKQMQSQLKSRRHNFHKIFKKFASKEEALKHLPKGLTSGQSMCERYSTPEFQL